MADALVLDGKTTALVLIDLQHGILARELAPYSGTQVVARAAGLAEAARAAGALVVYVHVDLNATLRPPVDRPMPAAGTAPPEVMEIVPEAGYQAGTDLLVLKRQWGAFYGTELDQMLRRRGVKTIVMCGVATNLGVESTARAAQERGYALVFASDTMTSRTNEMHQFALETIFPMMGRVRTAAEIETAFQVTS